MVAISIWKFGLYAIVLVLNQLLLSKTYRIKIGYWQSSDESRARKNTRRSLACGPVVCIILPSSHPIVDASQSQIIQEEHLREENVDG